MKTRRLELSEHVPFHFGRRFCRLFAANKLDFTLAKPTAAGEPLATVEQLLEQGLIAHKAFRRDRLYGIAAPDTPSAHEFYRSLIIMDESLLKLYRAYQVGRIDIQQMKRLRRAICDPVSAYLTEITKK